MRISSQHAALAYHQPLRSSSAVVATRQSDTDTPIEGARVSLSPAAEGHAAHLAEAGPNHSPDGCESCTAMRPELSDAEKREVTELKARDREVRQHEQAHVAAAGAHANGGPQYEYQTGPDGVAYAVGGHVNIDTSAVDGDPSATLEKAAAIRRAALAPAEPSSQDQRVAAKAAAMASKARRELAEQRQPAEPVTRPSSAVASYSAAESAGLANS